ncbi:hypothetical protein K492DRAFT_6879 [Lichtheimia hyalospora FSU 10163]|nr:hypothetical protein K492DRAFT_6879 [Lichtheimia hyalospora FSU 10163]
MHLSPNLLFTKHLHTQTPSIIASAFYHHSSLLLLFYSFHSHTHTHIQAHIPPTLYTLSYKHSSPHLFSSLHVLFSFFLFHL